MKRSVRIAKVKECLGFTIIEALVVLFIFGLITVVFYEAFTVGSRLIIESKNRLGAIALANSKMEIVHNVDYDNIGTKTPDGHGGYSYGIPAGDILQDETVTVNTRSYHVHTFVQYIDDAFDGRVSGTNPLDSAPNDYKRVRIEVSWGQEGDDQSVSLVATFVPNGVESASSGGTLSVNILDTQGNGIGQATVHIANNTTSPHVNITTETDSSGNIMLPGAPAGTQSYQISVSKNGYFSVSSYPPYPTSTFNPQEIHASVVAGAMNSTSLITDRSADISLATKDVAGTALPHMAFSLVGGKQIGTNIDLSHVYVFDQASLATGGDGEWASLEQSAGVYTLDFSSNSHYQLLRLSSLESDKNTFTVLPGVNADVVATFVDDRVNGALVTVTDESSGIPVQGASVHVTQATLGYDVTVATDRYGQAYIPENSTPLVAETYDISVSASGFDSSSSSIQITSGLVTKSISLEN